jgi:hypothetical protein
MAQQPLVAQRLLLIEASRSQSVRDATSGRAALDECSARRKDLHLTTHNTQEKDIHAPAASEPTNERPQTHVLASAATAIGISVYCTN